MPPPPPRRSPLRTLLDGLGAGWSRAAPWLISLWQVLVACRAILAVLALGAMPLGTSQGADGLRVMVRCPFAQRTLFLAVVAGYGLVAWYFSRSVTTYAYAVPLLAPGSQASEPERRAATLWARHLPRWLGAAAPASVAAGVFAAAGPRSRLAWACIAIAAGVLAFAYQRRRWGVQLRHAGGRGARALRAVGPALGTRRVPVAAYRGFGDLPRLAVALLVALVGLDLLVIVTMAAAPVAVGRALGPMSVLILALAVWLALGSCLVYSGLRLQVPVISLCVIWVVLVSPCNDNHRVRAVAGGSTWRRPSTAQVFASFVARQPAAERRVPVVIVAAEGGGIRAAYWTAAVLARMQDEQPAFARRLFAISGVSGGSLGAAVFAAILRDRDALAAPGRCGARGLECCVRPVLADDHLSPILGMMLFPDLLQRFVPYGFAALDRSRGLEESWSRSFRRVTEVDRLSQPFAELAPVVLHEGKPVAAPSDLPLPALYLNATVVETGKRVLAAPVDVAAEKGTYLDVVDGIHAAGDTLSTSAVVHMSARFPYVSPVGLLPSRGEAALHVADGGYFEGSGAATAVEILRAVADEAAARQVAWTPYVLLVTNDDEGCVVPHRWLTEVLGPPRALLATRGAHSAVAVRELERLVRDEFHGKLLVMNVPAAKLQVPLGWVLSTDARKALEAQVDLEVGRHEVQGLLEELKEDGAPGPVLRPAAWTSGCGSP